MKKYGHHTYKIMFPVVPNESDQRPSHCKNITFVNKTDAFCSDHNRRTQLQKQQ